jgi:GNAT superfamily N-acetyltransferase
VVAERDGAPVGFLVGSVDQRRHVAWTLEHERVALALRGGAGLLAHPGVLAVFLRTRLVRYARRLLPRAGASRVAPGGGAGPVPAPVAVVAAVVVDPAARGSGAGRLLVEAFLAAAAQAGTERAELVTLAGDGGASAFYARLGWEALEEHLNRDGALVRRFATGTAPRARREDPRGGPAAGGTGAPSIDLRGGEGVDRRRSGERESGTWLEPTV